MVFNGLLELLLSTTVVFTLPGVSYLIFFFEEIPKLKNI